MQYPPHSGIIKIRSFPRWCCLLSLLTLSGCQSPDKKLVSHYGDVSEVYQAYAIQPIETESLTWEDAEVRLLRGNLGLIGASNGILLARENTQRVFLNLMPSLNITANLAKRLTNIGQLDERDLDIGIFSSVSVPGIIQLRLNHYTALLQEVRAAWVWELEKRQRTVQLHQLFIRQKNLDRRSRTLRLSALADSQTGLAGEIVGERPAELERKNRLWALDRDYDRLQLDISRLLGDFSARWTLNTNSLPILYPPHTLPNLTEKDRIAVLWRQLQATELEAARLRERGAVLDYWPDLSLNLTAPPLYQRINGATRDFEGKEITSTFRSTLRVDTSLRNTYRLRQLRRNNAILLARIKEDVASLIQQLKDGQVAYRINAEEAVLVQTQYDLLLQNLSRGGMSNANNKLESLLRLEEQLARIESEQAEIQALFWLLDESKWTRLDFDDLLRSAKEREVRHAFD
jgi:hypothetical protein